MTDIDFKFFNNIEVDSLPPFQQAVFRGQQQAIAENIIFKLQQLPSNTTHQLVDESTALMIAARINRVDITQQLLSEVNYLNCHGFGAIHVAVKYNAVDIVNLLVQYEKDLLTATKETPFMIAALSGTHNILQIFKHQIGLLNHLNQNALMLAAQNNCITSIFTILKLDTSQIELNQTDKSGNNALYYALKHQQTASAALLHQHMEVTNFELLQQIAKSGDVFSLCLFNKGILKNENGETLLMQFTKNLSYYSDLYAKMFTTPERSFQEEKDAFMQQAGKVATIKYQIILGWLQDYLPKVELKENATQTELLKYICSYLSSSIRNGCQQQSSIKDNHGRTALVHLLSIQKQKSECQCGQNFDFDVQIKERFIQKFQYAFELTMQLKKVLQDKYTTQVSLKIVDKVIQDIEICPICSQHAFSKQFERVVSFLEPEFLEVFENHSMFELFLSNKWLLTHLDQTSQDIVIQLFLDKSVKLNNTFLDIFLLQFDQYLKLISQQSLAKILSIFPKQKVLKLLMKYYDYSKQIIKQMNLETEINDILMEQKILEEELKNNSGPVDKNWHHIIQEVFDLQNRGSLSENCQFCCRLSALMTQMIKGDLKDAKVALIGQQHGSLFTTALIYYIIYCPTLTFVKLNLLIERENSSIDKDGHTALFYAVRHNQLEIAQMLVIYNKEVNNDISSRSILMEACINFQNTEMLDFVLKNTQLLTKQCDLESGKTALAFLCESIIIQNKHYPTQEQLKYFATEIDVFMQDILDIFEFVIKLPCENYQLQEKLIRDILAIRGSKYNKNNLTPLSLSVQCENSNLANNFLDFAGEFKETSASQICIEKNNIQVLSKIFEHEISFLDQNQNNLLMLAAIYNCAEAAKLIYEFSSQQLAFKNSKGFNAVQLSIIHNGSSVYDYFESVLEFTKDDFNSYLEVAILYENSYVIQKIIQKDQNVVVRGTSPILFSLSQQKFRASESILDVIKLSRVSTHELAVPELLQAEKGLETNTVGFRRPSFDLQSYQGKTALMYSVQYGQIHLLSKLVDQDQKIITPEADKTALMFAIETDVDPEVRHQMLELLLHHEARIANSQGITAFHLLMQSNVDNILPKSYALVAKYEQLCRDNKGFSGVARAVMLGNYFTLENLFHADNDVTFYQPLLNEEQETPLMTAAKLNDARAVQILLGYEAKIQQTDGTTALMIAIQNNALDCVKLLMTKELTVKKKGMVTNLMLAATSTNHEIIRVLINYMLENPDVSEFLQMSDHGKSALGLAVTNNNNDGVTLLSKVESGFPNKVTGDSGLMMAVLQNKPDIVKLLAQTKDMNLVNAKTSQTSLMIAAETGNFLCAQYLKAEAGVSMVDGTTAMILAVYNNSLPIVKLLVEKEQGKFTTSLYLPKCVNYKWFIKRADAEKGKEVLLKKLDKAQKHSGSIIMLNEGQKTALMVAAELGRYEVAEFLMLFEANIVNPVNSWSAIHYAAMNGHGRITHMLSLKEKLGEDYKKVAKAFGMKDYV